jgi:U2 small nuclear ribonucleoprotein B''
MCYSAFGRVLDVVCLKTSALRGQAWVVFADVPSATSALRALQGFNFYDRPLVRHSFAQRRRRRHLLRTPCSRSRQRLAFAHGKSDAVSKADGTWLPKDKRVRGPQAPGAAALEGCGFRSLAAEERTKRAREGEEEEEEAAASIPVRAPVGDANSILFLDSLPEATTAAMLTLLFKQFPGFSEVRMVEARPGIAFVEFESELHAGTALSGLNGFKISPTHSLHITYALKSNK